MLRNVSLLNRRKKSDAPAKLTQQLRSPDEEVSPSGGMGDRSANASSFFPSNNNSMANLSRMSTQVGKQQGLTKGVVSAPGIDMPIIKPSIDNVEGDARTWCDGLRNGDISVLAAQLKSESSSCVDREIDDVSLLCLCGLDLPILSRLTKSHFS